MAKKAYVATIQLLVVQSEPPHTQCPADDINDILRNVQFRFPSWLIDWGYLKIGGQYLYATEQPGINLDTYKEGDFLR